MSQKATKANSSPKYGLNKAKKPPKVIPQPTALRYMIQMIPLHDILNMHQNVEIGPAIIQANERF